MGGRPGYLPGRRAPGRGFAAGAALSPGPVGDAVSVLDETLELVANMRMTCDAAAGTAEQVGDPELSHRLDFLAASIVSLGDYLVALKREERAAR
jgi:hypothetical protein